MILGVINRFILLRVCLRGVSLILKILNFYAVGSLFAFGITYLDCIKYKEHFDEFDYEDRHYMALFFISSVLSWYIPINYILELLLLESISILTNTLEIGRYEIS